MTKTPDRVWFAIGVTWMIVACGDGTRENDKADRVARLERSRPANGVTYADKDLEFLRGVLVSAPERFRELAWNDSGALEVEDIDTGLHFVLIPSGASAAPRTSRPVSVSAFLLATTECTNHAWRRGGGDLIDHPDFDKGPEAPVVRISWLDAVEWCIENGYRLPSESEWYRACVIGQEATEGELIWGRGAQTQKSTLGQKDRLGVWNMLGNVSEMCEDCHDSFGEFGEEIVPEDGGSVRIESEEFVEKGGSTRSYASPHPDERDFDTKESWGFDRGFRPVISERSGPVDPRTKAEPKTFYEAHGWRPPTKNPRGR